MIIGSLSDPVICSSNHWMADCRLTIFDCHSRGRLPQGGIVSACLGQYHCKLNSPDDPMGK